MPDPPPWTECLPPPPSHGYVQTATIETRMQIAEWTLLLDDDKIGEWAYRRASELDL